MKLYVCYGTFKTPRPGGHPCANAHQALRQAGHDPNVIKALGFGALPDLLNTPKRRMLKKETGSAWVPVLETDDGELISGSKRIVAWAEQHPASSAAG
jgi:hypothetical protein